MSSIVSRAITRYHDEGGAALVERACERVLCTVLPYRYYWNLSSVYHRRMGSFDVDAWDCPTDPFALLRVDPASITRLTNRPWRPWDDRGEHLGSVWDEDWDQPGQRTVAHESYPERFDDLPAVGALEQHFVEGRPWEDVEFVRESIERAERGRGRVGDASAADVLARYRSYDALYERIETDGYLSQFELARRDDERMTFPQALKGEVAVDVGRDGELLFVDGRHRLAIAKLLELESIPVLVLVRHEAWMETRQRAFSEGTNVDHPDLEFGGR